MVHWLAVGSTFGHRAFTATTAHTYAIHNVTCMHKHTISARGTLACRDRHLRGSALTLLGLVAQSAGLVGSGGSGGTVQVGQLPVLPAADTQKEAHHIGLLLAP